MAAERDFELLDDYLANRMNESERVGFEKKLDENSALKSEFDLQQRLVKAIKNKRVTELKAKLNAIPTPQAHGTTNAFKKIAASVAVSAIVATGLYFYFDSEDNIVTTEQVTETTPEVSTDQKSEQSDVVQQTPVEAQKEETPAKSNTSEEKPKAGKSPAQVQTPPQEQAKKPVLDVFTPDEETADPVIENNEYVPSEENTPRESSLAVTVNENSEYKFHYQFKDGQLYLYGPFDSNLYEVMEFFNGDKRTVFLYYNSNYFLLKDESGKVSSLTAITDPELLKKLKAYRSK